MSNEISEGQNQGRVYFGSSSEYVTIVRVLWNSGTSAVGFQTIHKQSVLMSHGDISQQIYGEGHFGLSPSMTIVIRNNSTTHTG